MFGKCVPIDHERDVEKSKGCRYMMTRIKLKTKNMGIKFKDLALVSGISYTYTVQILSGKKRPSIEVAQKLADAFNKLVEKEEVYAKDFNPKS